MLSRKMVFILLGAVLVCQANAANLLTNGDFNTGDLSGWWTWVAVSGSQTVTIEPNAPGYDLYDGTPCAKLWSNSSTWSANLGQNTASGVISGNMQYTLSFVYSAVTPTDLGSAGVSIDYYNSSWTKIGWGWIELYNQGAAPNETDEWLSYSGDFTSPAGTMYVQVTFKAADSTTLYVDNVDISLPPLSDFVPANGATIYWEDPDNCGYGMALHWKPTANATGPFYVYLGTSEQAVADATTSSPEYKGTVSYNISDPNTDPNYVMSLVDIAKDQTYYWRIDETTAGGVIKAESVWYFNVGPFSDLDVFGYASDTQLQAVWGTGVILNSGAMQITYNNTASPYYTQAEADASLLGCSTDWTRSGNQLLTLEVKGHDNMSDSMYVTLESNSGAESGTVQYADEKELNQQPGYEWFHFWVMDLQEFADQGVDLTNISKIIIGIGDGFTPAAGGSGDVLVDNLRLSSPMCLRGYTPADINNDCIVDIYDMFEVSGYWLNEGYTVTAQEPSVGPVVWYQFDEKSGTTIVDSSGFGYDGTLNIAGTWVAGINDSNSLDLNHTTYVQVPIGAANIGDPNGDPNTMALGAESTISLWFNDPGQSDNNSGQGLELFQIGSNGEVVGCWLKATGNIEYTTAGGNWLGWNGSAKFAANDIYTNPDCPQNQWVHYAFVKSYNAGYMRIYQNGKLVAQAFADGNYSPDIDGVTGYFSIGAWRWNGGDGGYMYGLIDDFRVYNYALSQAEVLSLAVAGGAATSPMVQDLILPGDVTTDSKINLEDFAEVAIKWMEEVAYPL